MRACDNLLVASLLLIPVVLIVSGAVLPQQSKTKTTAPHITSGIDQFLNQSITKKCFIPFLAFNNISQDSYHADMEKLNSFCNNTSSSGKQQVGTVELCELIVHMLDKICNMTTQNILPNDKSLLGPFNASLSDVLKAQEKKPVDEFCTQMSTKEPPMQPLDLKNPELGDFYVQFLNNPTEVKNGSCSSVCQKDAATVVEGVKGLQINPLCIVFNFTSTAFRSIKRQLSSSSIPAATKDALLLAQRKKMSDKKVTEKRKKPAAEKGQQKSSDIDGVVEDKSKKQSSAVNENKDQVGHKSSKEEPAEILRPKVESSSRDPPEENYGEDMVPMNVNDKPSSVAPPPPKNNNPPEGKGTAKKEESISSPKKPSSSDTNKAPLVDNNDNENENDGGEDQLPVDYNPPVSPNLDEGDTSDEIPPPPEVVKTPVNDNVVDRPVHNDIKQKDDKPNRKVTVLYQPNGIDKEDADGGYFNYFVFIVTFFALIFLAFHNKRRLIAYIVEGRKPRGASRGGSRRRSVSETSYRRLENNFE